MIKHGHFFINMLLDPMVLLAVWTLISKIQYFIAMLTHLIGLSQCAAQIATH